MLTEKCITFTVQIEKEVITTGKNREKVTSYILQFFDSAKCMAKLLSNLVINHSEGIYKINFKHDQNHKKGEICRIKYKYCDLFSGIHRH